MSDTLEIRRCAGHVPLVSVVVLLAAGCGGGSPDTAARPPTPKLPHALAQSWARQADAIAADLAAGDGCLAQTRAVALRTQVVAAVNDRRIARRYLEPLVGTVNDLPGRISCAPPPAPPPSPDNSKAGHGHKGHGKHGKGDD